MTSKSLPIMIFQENYPKQKSSPAFNRQTPLFEVLGSVLQQVDLPGSVLHVPSIKLHDAFNLLKGEHVDRDRLPDDIPPDALGAGRRGQRTPVLVDVALAQVLRQATEVERACVSGRAGRGHLVYALKDAVDDLVVVLIQLDEEADDGDCLVYTYLDILVSILSSWSFIGQTTWRR